MARLRRAFRTLERRGIVTRENYCCCGRCGESAIRDEITMLAASGHRLRGFAFYHEQDLESVEDGDCLHLSYGAVADGEAAALAVARTVVNVLRQQGLRVTWNGTWQTRIAVDVA